MLASSTLGDYSRCIIVGVFSDYIGLVAVLVAENGEYNYGRQNRDCGRWKVKIVAVFAT